MKIDTGILNKTKCNNMEKEYTPSSMRFHIPTRAKQEVTQHIKRIKNRNHMMTKQKSL